VILIGNARKPSKKRTRLDLPRRMREAHALREMVRNQDVFAAAVL
jgi:hypothetical protein